MKRMRGIAAGIVLTLLLSACGGPIDESLLPTPVPTYGPERFAIDPIVQVPDEAPPVATPVPAEEPAVVEDEPATEADSADVDVAIDDELIDDEEPTAEEITDELVDEAAEADEMVAEDVGLEAEDAVEEAAVEEDATEEIAVEDAVVEDETEAADELADEATVTDEAESSEGAADEAVEEAADEEATEQEGIQQEDAQQEDAEPEDEIGIHPDWEGLPEPVLAAMETADPGRGQQLSLVQGCVGCHALNPDQIMAGPTWYNMAATARTRVEGESAGLYLYNSIMYPNDYIVEGYLPNIMLQIYQDILDDQETADIIAYLLTLEEE